MKISSAHVAKKAGFCNTKEEPSVSQIVHPGSIQEKMYSAVNRTVIVSNKLFPFGPTCLSNV